MMRMIPPILAYLAAAAVGAVFLGSGLAKANQPALFADHLRSLGVPARLARPAAAGFMALEGALGAALLVAAWPRRVVPAAMLLLIVLTAVTLWSTRSGRAEDCGCYGVFFRPSPGQTLALNALYLVLLTLAWPHLPPTPTPLWKMGIVALAAAVVPAIAAISHARLLRTGAPLVDRGPLRLGKMAELDWLSPEARRGMAKGEVLLVFLSTTCPTCKQWLIALNDLHQRPGSPRVLAVFGESAEAVARFVREQQILFPVTTVPLDSLKRVVARAPTAVLIVAGIVRARWVRELPTDPAHQLTIAPND